MLLRVLGDLDVEQVAGIVGKTPGAVRVAQHRALQRLQRTWRKSCNAMSASDDFPRDMHKYPFDDSDADAVFGSSSGADAVPEDLRDLAELVDAARRAGSADELVGEDVIVGQIAAAVGVHVSSAGTDTASPPADAHERISVLSKFRTAKLAAAATAIVVLGATAAAAATGSLPTPVQSSVAKGLSGVGISVPADEHVALGVEGCSCCRGRVTTLPGSITGRTGPAWSRR